MANYIYNDHYIPSWADSAARRRARLDRRRRLAQTEKQRATDAEHRQKQRIQMLRFGHLAPAQDPTNRDAIPDQTARLEYLSAPWATRPDFDS